jgi:hypothetical protein
MASIDRRVFDAAAQRVASGALGIIRNAARFDRGVFDAGAARATIFTLRAIRAAAQFDVKRIDIFVSDAASRVLALSERLRRLQTGRVENYLLPLFVWTVFLVVLAALLSRVA